MKILFDHCVPRTLRRAFTSHEVKTCRQMRWEDFGNGVLLAKAATAFDAFLTVDKNIQHQQNISTLPIRVIVLDTPSNNIQSLIPLIPTVEELLRTLRPGQLAIINASGVVRYLN